MFIRTLPASAFDSKKAAGNMHDVFSWPSIFGAICYIGGAILILVYYLIFMFILPYQPLLSSVITTLAMAGAAEYLIKFDSNV